MFRHDAAPSRLGDGGELRRAAQDVVELRDHVVCIGEAHTLPPWFKAARQLARVWREEESVARGNVERSQCHSGVNAGTREVQRQLRARVVRAGTGDAAVSRDRLEAEALPPAADEGEVLAEPCC